MEWLIGPFKRSDQTFDERIEPEASMTALGRVVYEFAKLENHVSASIRILAPACTESAIAELPFKEKLDRMVSLVRNAAGSRRFNTGKYDTMEWLDKVVASCVQSEELRNRVMHSSWTDVATLSRERRNGIPKNWVSYSDQVDADYVLDIAEYILVVAIEVEEFFFDVSDTDES